MSELIKVKAQTSLEVLVHCPKCAAFLDVTEELREELDEHLRADNIDREITCDECDSEFIVTDIHF